MNKTDKDGSGGEVGDCGGADVHGGCDCMF